jgi:hypothetical protein
MANPKEADGAVSNIDFPSSIFFCHLIFMLSIYGHGDYAHLMRV